MKLKQMIVPLWLLVLILFAALHFVHLEADFPNYSRWMDYSKYTDEGWYANAAIEHTLRGTWYVPGDFNTGAAVPVWPVLEASLFHFTGVTIAAARALSVSLFCCNLLISYLLVRQQEQRWVALLAASLIATSSFLYCFSRLAILEPLLVCLTLSSLLLAQRLGRMKSEYQRLAAAATIGLLFCCMVLTKTTAVFLTPALLYSLWYPLRKSRAAFLRALSMVVMVAGLLWGSYFFLLVHPGFVVDYQYFFRINVYSKPTTILGWLATCYYSVHGVLWLDRALIWEAALLLLVTTALSRSIWRNPLLVSSLLAIGGYIAFIAYIDNMQPRYYAIIAYFLFFIVALTSAALVREQRAPGVLALLLVGVSVTTNGFQLINFVVHPQYTFVNASRSLTKYIDEHPNGNRILVSISGNEIGLVTGIRSLCDDFGTLDLPTKLAKYKPGWYAAWNELDPGTLEDLQTQFTLEEVANYRAFDDEDRDVLVLYKLHSRNDPSQSPRRRKKAARRGPGARHKEDPTKH